MTHHEQIDLTTLEEVERLLSSTDFASADDLIGRTGALTSAARSEASAPSLQSRPNAEGGPSLPRRR